MATVAVLGGMVMASLDASTTGARSGRLARFVAEQASASAATAAASRRAVLYGERLEESVEVTYQLAASMLGRSDWRTGPKLVGAEPQQVATRAAVWPALEPIVAALRRATHLAAAPRRVDFFLSRRCDQVLEVAGQYAADRAAWRECVDVWLDRAILFLDHRGFEFGHWPGLAAEWTEPRLAAIDVAAARMLGSGLERLEALWPREVSPRAWLASIAVEHLHPPLRPGAGWFARVHAWRVERYERGCIEAFVDGLRCLEPAAAEWEPREQQWRDFFRHGDAFGLSRDGWAGCVHRSEVELRNELTRIRLLRLALAFRLGAQLPSLADPFADRPLQIEVHADRAHFRSAATHAALQRVAFRR